VVKDFSPRALWVRNLFGPWINRREIRAYRALDGHRSVPRLFGELDAQAFAVEYRPGHYVNRGQAKGLSPTFLDELEEDIEEMHRSGVIHLDLRHRTNILLGRDGHPVLLDFASALVSRPGSGWARCLQFLFGGVDRRALEKWQVRLTPLSKSKDSSGSTPPR
jgi:serine/threonine protein kinase